MNVIVWARVSSREQKEGYSLDAQLRATREKAVREGWRVVREFAVAESAKRGADRVAFNEMFAWVRHNAKKEGIRAILSHKLDRACRNMRDAVRLQQLEDDCGVGLTFVENQFGPGAAGALSFNVMAAVSQYYSDNLRGEVLKGMDEKVRQGWLPANAPYGYLNVKDSDEPVQPDPDTAQAVIRMFQLYSTGTMTFEALADRLASEGHTYRKSQPRFHRTALSYILNNRFYIGEIVWHGKTHPGRHRPLVLRETFDACQEVLQGRNRRTGKRNHTFAGGLFTCAHCGRSVTGERIRRRLSGGRVREHHYYRCANNHPGPDHPTVRWRAPDIEEAITRDLGALVIPSGDLRRWFRDSLEHALEDVTAYRRREREAAQKRRDEIKAMQDRLLDAYLGGVIAEGTFEEKSEQLKGQMAEAEARLERSGDTPPMGGDMALQVFDWTQRLPEVWRGSNDARKRLILEAVSLNRILSDVTLTLEKRKPFDILAEGPSFKDGRGGEI